MTLQFVERVKDEYGDGSTVYQSRVLGEFPEESESSLVLHRWVREAQANFASGVHEELSRKRSWVAAVDPARMGPDKTALGLRQGLTFRSVTCWHHAVRWPPADISLVCCEAKDWMRPRTTRFVLTWMPSSYTTTLRLDMPG